MTKDFSKYQDIIDSFRGKVNKAGFDTKFALSTNHLAKTETFILKMELKRLAAACTRSIDLRGLVDGVCKLFEYNGQSHFLDDVAIRVFEDNVAEYGDYTFGVYDAVKNTENNFRVIYQNEQAGNIRTSADSLKKMQEKLQYPASLYQFDDYDDRFEERMNFAIAIIVILENKQELKATSSDISMTGCKFRLTNERPLKIGQIVEIQFSGLEQEFQFSTTDVFPFEVRNIHRDGNTQLIGCQRIQVSEKDILKQFLSGYIQGNKRRYKINLENTITALQARSFEQYLLPKLTELPVFIEKNESGLVPRYALTTNNNQAIYQYWQDETGNSTLSLLLNEKRLERLQKTTDNSLLVYSFIHQTQGKSFFYSMDTEQLLAESGFSSFFLTFAANQKTFSITELSCVKVDQNHAHSAFTLANTHSLKEQYINLPPSDEVITSLALIPFISVVNDITHPSLVAHYQQISSGKISSANLKKYGHRRLTKPIIVDELGVSYKNQRQELRFIYDTPVIIECEKTHWQGNSHDFSVSGLKVELDNPAMLAKGDVVYLTFPKLQKITSAFDLKQLSYEVVRINKKKTILNLRVHVKSHKHIGRAFFKLLISKNRHKLTPDEYAMLTPGLADALRTSYAKNMNVPALLVQASGSRYKIEAIASNNDSSELFKQMRRLSDRENYYNLYPLLTKLQSSGLLEQHLKTLLMGDESIAELLYIAVDINEFKVDKSVQVTLDSELSTPELKRLFIKKSLKRGQFYCLKLMITRTNEPDMEYLNAELSYISSYALHRGKKLEQDIWSVVGMIQCFDITKEALSCYNLPNA
ncbi:PilZ domain-containing protein [Candidatus Colwellia aromaticivorans]|uniref:PilZ domain-containing protein n=1 Tax=Candidatus Colwellia aromaticivorans TaxID=2267621 RepID=UPI000DF1D533|nr:PilZ domain-containing protein [Candidatus Colwellia aromaticivorans]